MQNAKMLVRLNTAKTIANHKILWLAYFITTKCNRGGESVRVGAVVRWCAMGKFGRVSCKKKIEILFARVYN